MIGKLFLFSFLLFLVGFATAQSPEEFLKQLEAENRFVEENPCLGRNDSHFAANTRGCSWYHECVDGVAVRQDRCPAGFWFDYVNQVCNYKVNVKCDLDDCLVSLECPARGPEVKVIPHRYSCSKYTVCFNGVENDRECPPGLHFSYYDNECVDPFLADCNLDRYTCIEAVETGLPVFVQNKRDCGAFYVCVGEVAVPLFCRDGMQFNPKTRYCDEKDNVQCVPEIPTDNPNIPEKVFMECGDNVGVNVPHPDSCGFYFFCAGRSFLQSCNPPLIFDIDTNRCNTRESGRCILDSLVTDQTTESSTAE